VSYKKEHRPENFGKPHNIAWKLWQPVH